MSQTILVVDDEADIRFLLREFLGDEGYSVLTASNGKEALALAESASPALILLDMNMPVMDGWAFARSYRRDVEDPAPIIVLTAGGSAARRAADIDAAGFVAKPFDIDDLLDLVTKHVSLPNGFADSHSNGEPVQQ